MPCWKVTPIRQAPELTLINWFVAETHTGERHFVGYNITDREGRVSSAIQRFDPETMTGITRSGRVYRLRGGPGHDPDAGHVWNRWRAINGVESWTDVTKDLMNGAQSRPKLEANQPAILFLDYDGVLHPDCVYREQGQIVLKCDGIRLFEWVPLLEEALAPYPQVRIVLSTSWVRVLSFNEAKSRLPESLQARVIGATYHSKMYERTEGLWAGPDPFALLSRYEQIMGHVVRHAVERWLAIDDDIEHWPEDQRDRLVATDGDLGLAEHKTLQDLERKLALLASQGGEPTEAQWLAARKAVQDQAVALLGNDVTENLLQQGKLHSAGRWSGQYLSALASSVEGCDFIGQLLSMLKAGLPVPIVFPSQDDTRSVELSTLQFTGGRLVMLRNDGTRTPVAFP